MNRFLFVAIPAMSATLLAGCATTPDVDPVAAQFAQQDQRLQDLRAEVVELRARLDGIGAAGIGNTLTGMESEVRELRGEMERLQFELRDMQQRRQSVESGARAPDGAPRPSTDLPSSSSAAGQDDQAAYLDAFGKLKSGDYGQAISAFGGFLDDHPSSAYAPNAQYWIGEAHYVQRDFDAAWTAFAAVEERFPNSLKAADARLKQGLIRVDQGRMRDARAIFQEVASKHAGSSAARLASERLQRMGGN